MERARYCEAQRTAPVGDSSGRVMCAATEPATAENPVRTSSRPGWGSGVGLAPLGSGQVAKVRSGHTGPVRSQRSGRVTKVRTGHKGPDRSQRSGQVTQVRTGHTGPDGSHRSGRVTQVRTGLESRDGRRRCRASDQTGQCLAGGDESSAGIARDKHSGSRQCEAPRDPGEEAPSVSHNLGGQVTDGRAARATGCLRIQAARPRPPPKPRVRF